MRSQTTRRSLANPRAPPRRWRFTLLLLAYFVLVVFPMVWVGYTSLKPDKDVFAHPFRPPAWSEVHWSNYPNAWVKAHFGDYFLNSLVLTLTSVLGVTFFSSMAAYALARFAFPGCPGDLLLLPCRPDDPAATGDHPAVLSAQVDEPARLAHGLAPVLSRLRDAVRGFRPRGVLPLPSVELA